MCINANILRFIRINAHLSDLSDKSDKSDNIGYDWWRSLRVRCGNRYGSSGVAAAADPVTTGYNLLLSLNFELLRERLRQFHEDS